MLNAGRFIVAIAVALAAIPAQAQTPHARGAFVEGSVGPDWDDSAYESSRVPGATWRAGFAVGFDWGRSGVELDVSVPQWHVKQYGPDRFTYAGPTYGWEQQGHRYESSATARRRTIDVTAFYRANFPLNRHLTVSGLAGLAYLDRPEEFTSVTKEVLPGGQLVEVNTRHTTSYRNYMAAAGRVDVEWRVVSHLSVVPRLRIMILPSLLDDSGLAPRMLQARPEVAVRWRF